MTGLDRCRRQVWRAVAAIILAWLVSGAGSAWAAHLYVVSSGASVVPISSATGHGGTTDYSVAELGGGTSVQLTAPTVQDDRYFEYWEGCDTLSGTQGEVCALTMPNVYILVYCETSASNPCPADRKVRAVYRQASRLTVTALGTTGVPVVSDTGHGGVTDYHLSDIASGTAVSLTAPLLAPDGSRFSDWEGCDSTVGASANTCRTTTPTIYCITTPCPQNWQVALTAKYLPAPVIYALEVNAVGATGVVIASTTGHGGITPYRQSEIVAGSLVELSAPATAGNANFKAWQGCATTAGTAGALCQLRMDEASAVVAYYEESVPSVTGLAIAGPARLQANGRITLTAAMTYPDGVRKEVVPEWTSSAPATATLSAAGVLTAGSVTVDTPVVVTATYTENHKTFVASTTVTVTAAPADLASLDIVGGNVVSSGGLLRLGAMATYADGSARRVLPSAWSVSPSSLGTIDARGALVVGTVATDTALVVYASHMENGVTKTASLSIALKAAPAALASLAIVGARGMLAGGESLDLVAESGYADGSGKRVAANWSLSDPGVASITASGRFVAGTVLVDTPVRVTATYAEGGDTVSAQYSIIVKAAAEPPRLTAEVIATRDTGNLTKLQLWFNTDAAAATTTRARMQRAEKQYKLFVAALLPPGPLVTEPTFFLLNRSHEWQRLDWPLAEYLSGVRENDWQLIELIDAFDASLISGTQIFVGYGTSDTEMVDAKRYWVVYQIP